MTSFRLVLLLLGLTHLRGCFTPLCDAVRGFSETSTVVTRTGTELLVSAVRGAEGNLAVATSMGFMPPEYHYTVVEMSESGGPNEIARFKLTSDFGGALSGENGKWWFSLAGRETEDHAALVAFVTPELRKVRVAVGGGGGEWLPFDGAEPRGLLVSFGAASHRAIEVTPGGARREWPLPVVNSFSTGWWAAERLAGGSIALVQYDHSAASVILRILGSDVKELVLRDQLGGSARVATAISAEGDQLGVVIELKDGTIEAAVIGPVVPATIDWKKVTAKDDPGRYPAAAFHEGKLVVAWFASQTDQLRARTLTGGHLGPAATIAPLHRRGNTLPAISILPEGEEILFVWQADEITTRRVPAEFAGLNLIEALCSY